MVAFYFLTQFVLIILYFFTLDYCRCPYWATTPSTKFFDQKLGNNKKS